MPNIKPPEKYNFEELYLFCELSTQPDAGSRVDFSGIKTYNIGFLKEGVGFGITNISVDITPSMQPIIEITFKDFYGNASIEFKRNSGLLNGITENISEVNYSSLFQLPYPKFRLILKGYIGKPVSLDLNVKRIDVSYVANDGSYEIKAVFIPNLYGFFADMPFYFLKAIKYLKYKTGDRVPGDYVSIFDIIENGKKVQQNQMVAQKNIETLKRNLSILYNENEAIFDDDFDWYKSTLLENKDSNGEIIEGYNNRLYINVGKYTTRKTKDNNTTLFSPPDYAKRNRNFLRDVSNNSIFKKKIISSISTTNEHESNNDSKLIYLIDSPLNQSNYEKGKSLLKQAIDACNEYEKNQFIQTNKEVLERLTIKKVFDLLIEDSSYLMGRILQAGINGFQKDSDSRISNKKITGKYFPLIQNETTNEQQPYAFSGPESDFVNEFINALSNGIAEGERKKIDEDPVIPDNFENGIKKRITNLELGANNPYAISYNSNDIILNIIERTGILAHFFMDSINGDDDENEIIKSEIENIKIGLERILGSNNEDRSELLEFFKGVESIIDDEGEFKESADKSIITKRINQRGSKIDINTLRTNRIFNNNILYVVGETSNYDTYILFDTNSFKKNPSIYTSINSIESEGTDITAPFSDNDFKYYYVEEVDSNMNLLDMGIDYVQNYFNIGNPDEKIIPLNSLVINKQVYDYNKMQKLQPGESIENCLVDEEISRNSTKYPYTEKRYFYSKYRVEYRNSNTSYVWDLNGNTSEAKLQRRALKEISVKLKAEVQNSENKIKDEKQKITESIQNGLGYNILYKQFHTLCNNWKNLVDVDVQKNSGNFILEYITGKFFKNGTASNIFYEFPLQNIQPKSQIRVQDSIINIQPLYQNNEQSSVLNVMSNICLKNNFMFLPIPGLASSNDTTITNEPLNGLFVPYTNLIKYEDVEPINHFYVLWMPTPEDRVSFNNGEELYMDFNPENLGLSREVFQLDYGSPNNTIFKSINMTTEDNKMTSESAIAINTIADPQNSNNFKSFDCSALSVMEGRSYKISVEMIGNAQIKPTQFFVLNSTHVFSGLYQIMKVSHTLRPNEMTTKFEAIKMKYNGQFAGFSYIPPITLQDIYKQNNSRLNSNPSESNAIVTESNGFPLTESTINNYVGTITHPSIPLANRALLDTVSFLDNGINTPNKGYDVLVGSTYKNPRLIENWFPNYEQGMNFDEWKLQVQSPTLGGVVYTSAAGRYQIVYTTWRDSSQKINIPLTGSITNPKNPPFNKDNQDIIANFLLTSRLKSKGLNEKDIADAVYNYSKFESIMRAIRKEWESVDLLFIRGSFKGMNLKELYDFFVTAYNIYNSK